MSDQEGLPEEQSSVEPTNEFAMAESTELIPTKAPAGPKRRLVKVLSISLGVVVLGIGGAIAVFALKSGTGTQPEDVLPSNTLAFAKLDFNPTASQKIDFVRFVSRFPNTFKNFDANSPIDSILRATNKQVPSQWQEIKSWLGDRYAIAAVPDQGKISPVLVLALKNEGEMRTYIEKTDPQIHIAVQSGYGLLSPSQGALDDVAQSKAHLAEDAQFKSDLAALGGDQVALAWGNVKDLLQYAQSGLDSLASTQKLGDSVKQLKNLNGRVVLGVHFTARSIAVTLLTRDFTANSAANLPLANQTIDISDLPSDTLAGIGINGIGASLAKSISTVPNINDSLNTIGINASELRTLFSGGVTLFALPGQTGKNPDIGLRITPVDIAATSAVVEKILHGSNSILSLLSVKSAVVGNHIYVGLDATSLNSVVNRVADTTTPLKSDPAFTSSVTQTGYLVAFVNLKEAIPLLSPNTSLSALNAVALTSKIEDPSRGNSRTLLTLTLT